jgi:hypothetical protein
MLEKIISGGQTGAEGLEMLGELIEDAVRHA